MVDFLDSWSKSWRWFERHSAACLEEVTRERPENEKVEKKFKSSKNYQIVNLPSSFHDRSLPTADCWAEFWFTPAAHQMSISAYSVPHFDFGPGARGALQFIRHRQSAISTRVLTAIFLFVTLNLSTKILQNFKFRLQRVPWGIISHTLWLSSIQLSYHLHFSSSC